MYVKMLDGRFAGEIKDLRPDVALEWIRQGKAARAFDEIPAPILAQAATVQIAEPVPHATVTAGKRSGKKGNR